MKKAGAKVDSKNQRVTFESDWLDEVLANAPSRFTLYSRDGLNDLNLGEGKVHFANGGRVFRRLDSKKGAYRYTNLKDVIRTATLVNKLEHIALYIIACQAHNVKQEVYHLNDFFHAFNHTTKHVMGGCDNVQGAKQMWELSSFIAGSEENLKEKPFVSVITNPISPLTFEINTLEIIQFCCTRGIPVTCAPAPIAGATAPATLAGTLAQMHAESLAGVAIAQVFAPGAKTLYGAVPNSIDLRTLEFTMGSVEMGIMNAAAVQLAKLHDLPIYASSGVTDAKKPGLQAGCEKMITNIAVSMAGADLIHLAAGMMDSGNSISYAQLVIDNELIAMVYRVLEGIKVNEDTLGFDVIKKVGPGGNYIMEDHTVEHMMDEFFYPKLGVRLNYDVWEDQGKPTMVKRARDTFQSTIEENNEGLLPSDLVSEIKTKFPGIKNV
jgi:trimethylamine--corrinoid protein Co-methyltransferase